MNSMMSDILSVFNLATGTKAQGGKEDLPGITSPGQGALLEEVIIFDGTCFCRILRTQPPSVQTDRFRLRYLCAQSCRFTDNKVKIHEMDENSNTVRDDHSTFLCYCQR